MHKPNAGRMCSYEHDIEKFVRITVNKISVQKAGRIAILNVYFGRRRWPYDLHECHKENAHVIQIALFIKHS